MTSITDASPRYVWLMGLANMGYGYGYAVVLVTVPQLLATRGAAEPHIANLTALATVAGLATFALAPLLDCGISRRSWAIGLAVVAAALAFATLRMPVNSALLAPALASIALAVVLYNSAIGGWLGAAFAQKRG